MSLFASFARVVGDGLAAIAGIHSSQLPRDSHASAALSIQELGSGPPRTKLDVAKVRFLLSSPSSPLRRPAEGGRPALPPLPPEVVSLVLDFAEYYICKVSFLFAPATYVNDANELYLRTPPFEGVLVRGFLRRVEFRIVSHDQGFSGEPAHMHGTQEGSWTWWEATLDRPAATSATADEVEVHTADNDEPRGSDDADPADVRVEETGAPRDRHPTSGGTIVPPGEPTLGGQPVWNELARYELTRNLHAVRRFKEYLITFGPEHPLVQEARRGDSIGVWARTRFPAWRNHVKEVEVKIWQAL
ncbi:hypothetical protein ACQY0O_000796 [Thecaphora frezii]